MVNLFEYTDYRKYLKDFYEKKKENNPSFSYQKIAQKAGFQNRGFVYNLVNGKRALSKKNLAKMAEALQLGSLEARYFEVLVEFCQAEDPEQRAALFEKMNAIKTRGRSYTDAQRLRKDQYEYYSTWYHSVIRSLIGMYEFSGDFKWLSQMIRPPITVKQARDSVFLLKNLGLIQVGQDGVYKVTNQSITSGKEIELLAIRKFYFDCADLAKKAIDDYPKDVRCIKGLTMGVSTEAYKLICDEIELFTTRLVNIVKADKNSDRTYQLNMHLFPTSDYTVKSKE